MAVGPTAHVRRLRGSFLLAAVGRVRLLAWPPMLVRPIYSPPPRCNKKRTISSYFYKYNTVCIYAPLSLFILFIYFS